MKPIASRHKRWPLAPSPACGGGLGWGRGSGIADLFAASSTEAPAKAEAFRAGVCGFPPPQPSPARAGEGAQQRKRRYDSNQGNAGLVECFGSSNHIGILPDLILRSIAQAMRLEGWPRAAVQAAILRDARKSALLRMRSARVATELIGFTESIPQDRIASSLRFSQ